MPNPRRVINPPLATPVSMPMRLLGTGVEIPDDLLAEASRRLGTIALLGLVLWTVGVTLDHLALRALRPGEPYWRQLHVPDLIALAGMATSLGLVWYSRVTSRSPRSILDLGLVYLIVTSLEIALLWHWNPMGYRATVTPGFSWLGSLVLMFAAILPNPPWKTLLASLIAVSMNPLGMLVARARGVWDFGATSNVLLMHYPDYIMVGVAVVISRVVTRLGQKVTEARDLGSYHLGELLGQGGMGEVYRATHRMLARPAAIKLIRPAMLGGGAGGAELAIKRFKREAEVAASLRSPHTVELYDFGVTDDQTLYFVMELLQGMDLERLVRAHGPQPAGRVIRILRQVCDSLEEAHHRGLVHRDIKPANIHLGVLGLRHDFVKVLDFGLVKAVGPREEEVSLASATGDTPGTPAYMAPEAILGQPIDGRADLYALGCVGYFLLTGSVVFESASALQAAARHVTDVPVPPSARSGLSVPPALEAIILRLLAKRPEDRFASAAELDRALEQVEVAPWTPAHAAEWWQDVTQTS
ncbi:MAG: serine/threonine-protein kinase [Gemmatimonadales bacterium]